MFFIYDPVTIVTLQSSFTVLSLCLMGNVRETLSRVHDSTLLIFCLQKNLHFNIHFCLRLLYSTVAHVTQREVFPKAVHCVLIAPITVLPLPRR